MVPGKIKGAHGFFRVDLGLGFLGPPTWRAERERAAAASAAILRRSVLLTEGILEGCEGTDLGGLGPLLNC